MRELHEVTLPAYIPAIAQGVDAPENGGVRWSCTVK